MPDTMMKCGHAANAVDSDGNPSCAICVGTGACGRTVDDDPPDLEGRWARCGYTRGVPAARLVESAGCGLRNGCRCKMPSDGDRRLAFFEHRPESPFDSFYCGCWGWD